jgi:AraC family transcriptional regulator
MDDVTLLPNRQLRILVLEKKRYVPIIPESQLILNAAFLSRGVIVEKFWASEPIFYPERQPAAHQLFLCMGSHVRVTGELDGKQHDCMSGLGGIWILPKGVRMSGQWHGPHGGVILSIPESVFADVGALSNSRRPELAPAVNLADSRLVHLIHALLVEIADAPVVEVLLAETLANAICICLARLCTTGSVPTSRWRSGIPPIRLKRVRDFVESNLTDKLSLNDLARVAEMSVSHFGKLFRHSTGLSPWQFVRQQRIALAKDLLQKPRIKTSDVGLLVGYEHRNNFAKAFRQETGVSPRQFRRSHS